jgi:hypothetical protein
MNEGADAPQRDGGHYRELAARLRDIAGECRLPDEQEEFLQLAALFDRRAEQLDRRSPSFGHDAWLTTL